MDEPQVIPAVKRRFRTPRVIVPLTAELAEEQGRLVREGKRKARHNAGHGLVSSPVTGDDWEYIIKRVEGMGALPAVIAIADARGERISRTEANNRSRALENRLGAQIDHQIKGKVMSDDEFESWTRMKVEQLVATPSPNSQGVIRAIQFLKKNREERKARNTEALMNQVVECANRIAALDRLEEEAVKRGLIEAPTDGEHGSQ